MASIIKSPLGAMRLADRPEVVVLNESSRVSIEGSTGTEIDDVATLHAKLPSVKAVSEFGDVQSWSRSGKARKGVRSDDCVQGREDHRPRMRRTLLVRKTRDSGSMFQCTSIRALA